MADDEVGAQGVWVLAREKDGLAVVRPDATAVDVFDLIIQPFVRGQVLETKVVFSSAGEIDGERRQSVIRTNAQPANLAERLTLGQNIDIEHHLFGSVRLVKFATIDGILISRFKPCVINVPAVRVGYRRIILFDSPFDFREQFFFQRRDVGENRLGIIVLAIEVIDDFLVFAFT